MGNRTPSLGELVQEHIAAAFERLRVAQPARVESYDPVLRVAAVTPLLKAPVYGSDGVVSWVSLPRIEGVPVLMPGAGGRQVKLPVAAQDVVLLVFCDFSLDAWKAGAGAADPQGFVQPDLLATHSLADAIAIPGLLNPIGAPPATAIELLAGGAPQLQAALLGENLVAALKEFVAELYTASVGPLVALKPASQYLWTVLGGAGAPTPALPAAAGPVLSDSIRSG